MLYFIVTLSLTVSDNMEGTTEISHSILCFIIKKIMSHGRSRFSFEEFGIMTVRAWSIHLMDE
jgi:hypothetical protein